MSLKLDNHYHVEFIGLPGAGKSALAFEVINYLKNAGYICYDYDQVFKKSGMRNKWLTSFFYYIKNLKFFFFLLIYTVLSSPARLTVIRYNLGRFTELLKLIVIFNAFRKKSPESALFIFDQGVVQCLWSITSMGGKVRKGLLCKCLALNKSVLPWHILYVKIEPDIAVSRVINRDSKCVFDHLSPSACHELFNKQESNYLAIFEVIKNFGTLNILTLDGSAAISDNVPLVWNSIIKKIKVEYKQR
jgi:shikimate kinase